MGGFYPLSVILCFYFQLLYLAIFKQQHIKGQPKPILHVLYLTCSHRLKIICQFSENKCGIVCSYLFIWIKWIQVLSLKFQRSEAYLPWYYPLSYGYHCHCTYREHWCTTFTQLDGTNPAYDIKNHTTRIIFNVFRRINIPVPWNMTLIFDWFHLHKRIYWMLHWW